MKIHENLWKPGDEILETKEKVVSEIMSKDGNLGSYFVRDSKGSLIVVSLFLKDRHLGSTFLSDSKRSLIVVSPFLKDRQLGSLFLR